MDMNLETDAPQGGTEGEAIAQPSQVDAAPAASSEDTAEQQTGAVEPGPADETGEPTPKRTPWWEKRFGELTAKQRAAEREADYWRGVAEASTRQPASQPEPAGPPTEEEYNWDQAAYRKALNEYVASEAEKAASRVIEKRTAEQSQQSQLQAVNTKMEAAAAKRPDFLEVVHDIPLSPAVQDLLVNDPNATEVLYQAAKDPGEARRIFSLPPYQQAVELGKIAARLETPALSSPKPIPPAPPQTVGAVSAGLNKTPEEMSMAEFIAYREQQEKTQP
jgi:hypothetical protein